MKITFLGTGAGESYPGIWCECANCAYAREHGGKNLRMNTGSMLDDDVLLDMNHVGFHTAARMGVSLSKVKHLLVTHPHPDHIDIEPLYWRLETPGASGLPEDQRMTMGSPRFTPLPVMTVHGNALVKDLLVGSQPGLFDGSMHTRMVFREFAEYVPNDAGDGLVFIPVRARHGEPGFAHNFIIERGGRRLLYALDTGGYDDDQLRLILSFAYDAVVMEGTYGLRDAEGHMSTAKNIAFRELMLEKGCLATDTPFIITHMSPHWTPPHDVYAPMMAEKGFIVAYDGMVIDI